MPISGLKLWATGDALNSTNLNVDKAVLEAKFNAGITTADCATSAGFLNAQLANQHYEIIVPLVVTVPVGLARPGISATVPIAVAGLPGTNTDGISYTPVSATMALTDSGIVGATLTYQVDFGSFTGAGNTWASVGASVIATHASPASGTANAATQENPVVVTTALSLDAAVPRFLGLFITAYSDASVLAGGDYNFLRVDIKLKRTSGLRS